MRAGFGGLKSCEFWSAIRGDTYRTGVGKFPPFAPQSIATVRTALATGALNTLRSVHPCSLSMSSSSSEAVPAMMDASDGPWFVTVSAFGGFPIA